MDYSYCLVEEVVGFELTGAMASELDGLDGGEPPEARVPWNFLQDEAACGPSHTEHLCARDAQRGKRLQVP